jgi:replicative DNA helicase
MTVSAIRAECMKLKRERGLEVIIIDQLSYVIPDRPKNSRVDEFGDRMRGLYRLGQDLKILVIILHQLSRAVEQRPNKRPVLSDLRESGDLEQDADVVILLYRESYYRYLSRGEEEPSLGVMEWIQAKGRDIGVGIVKLQVDRSIQRIESSGDTHVENEDPPPAYLTPDPKLVQQAMFGDPPPVETDWDAIEREVNA